MQIQTCKFDYTYLACSQSAEKRHMYSSAQPQLEMIHNIIIQKLELLFLFWSEQVQGNHFSLVDMLWRKQNSKETTSF